jgi:taurine--2-oxoglutarate transaminase
MWALELVKDRQSREMLVPFNAAGESNLPMKRLAGACHELGLWPFTHFNRIHVAPPLVITRQELLDGIGKLDLALAVSDEYYSG